MRELARSAVDLPAGHIEDIPHLESRVRFMGSKAVIQGKKHTIALVVIALAVTPTISLIVLVILIETLLLLLSSILGIVCLAGSIAAADTGFRIRRQILDRAGRTGRLAGKKRHRDGILLGLGQRSH